jgi:protein transport protein SEC23
MATPMQQQFEEYEDRTGLKYVFNLLPRTKAQEKKCTIPLSCLYQPLRPKEDPVVLESPPLPCGNCRTILNPYCIMDSNGRGWTCSICNYRNQFPNQITAIPPEMDPSLMDVEYIIPPMNNMMLQKPTVFVYVVDLALEEEELEALRNSLIQSIQLLPANSMISLITYGKNVNVHQVGSHDVHYSHTFNGQREYTKDEIAKKLGLMKKSKSNNSHQEQSMDHENRFVQRMNMCEFTVTRIIELLKADSFKVEKYHRRERATGCAINVAFSILSTLYPKSGSRIMLFTGGPCTTGVGQIVGTSFTEPLRSHHDLLRDSKIKKKYNANIKFYQGIAEKASINGHTFDIFIGCYDQVGLNEMRSLVDKTGGVIVQSDSFTSAIFKQSLVKFLSVNEFGESQFGLNATLEIKSRNVKVSGFIGHATPLFLDKGGDSSNRMIFYTKTNGKAKNEGDIGISGTNVFKLGSVSTHSTYGVYFELDENVVGDYAIIQFITSYQHPDGNTHVHVTTSQRFIDSTGVMDGIIDYFDQEAAAVLIARQAVYKVLNNSNSDAVNFINKTLIDFMSTFCKYRTNDPSSIVIPFSINLLPQFLYHLRRSNFIQIFNSSPDESTFYRHCFFTEDCINSLTMIQPSLTSFELEKEPEPVLLDSTSIKPNRILFLDTFFHILIFHGSLIADWRRQGYQEQPDYEYFKDFLELPRQEAADILVDRFPLPRFIDTEEGGSQARFLMSKLNPTTNYNSGPSNVADSVANLGMQANPEFNTGGADTEGGAVIMTDDISLQTFMKFVYNAIVKPN